MNKTDAIANVEKTIHFLEGVIGFLKVNSSDTYAVQQIKRLYTQDLLHDLETHHEILHLLQGGSHDESIQ